VHRFRVDHAGADPDLGAIHTVEVPLVFGTYDDGGPGTRLAGDGPRSATVSGQMMAAWGAFVRGEGPGWPPLESGAGDESMRVFGSATAALPVSEK
jgi:para-nitrobenzyl esterase